MVERGDEPYDPKLQGPGVDPEGRPMEQRNTIVVPPQNPGRGSGAIIAGIVVVLLIIAGLVYATMPNGGTSSPQTTQTTQTAPDQTSTGSTAKAPAAPNTAKPAQTAPTTNSAPATSPNQ